MHTDVLDLAVLGLGAMGSRMAARLLQAGHRVTVWNRSAAAATTLQALGAKVAASPRQAAAEADYVICMVRDDIASRHVWADGDSGALAGMRPRAVAVDSSTLTPAWSRELGKLCTAQQLGFLEAPVAGSRPQADAGQLIYFVGGDETLLAAAKPLFMAMGSAVHHAGSVGNAALVKLMVNALLGVQVAAVAELLGLSQKAGMDASRAFEILSATPVASPAAKGAGLAMLSGNFEPLFPLELVGKDFSYLLQTAAAADAELAVAASVQRVVRRAIEGGLQDRNITALGSVYLR